MNTTPSPHLPAWALAWFNAQRHRFDDPEEMPHRRDAFYRLLCADALDVGMRRLWLEADKHLGDDFDRDAFLGVLIYSVDDVIPDERYPVYSRPPVIPEARLREADRRLARKLARLLREMFIVTPPRCQAKAAEAVQFTGGAVERLLIAYDLDLPPDNVGEIYRRRGIEYTSDSKRGWTQRRHASDLVRNKAIIAARRLSEIGRPQDAGWLDQLADALRLLPDMETEHGHRAELRSHKCGWPDWLRGAHRDLNGVCDRDQFPRVVDWSALVRVLFDGVDVSDVRIGQVLKEGK